MSETEFETVKDALDALQQDNASESEIRKQFGDVDGIQRSIAVALSKQQNTTSREDVSDIVTRGVQLD